MLEFDAAPFKETNLRCLQLHLIGHSAPYRPFLEYYIYENIHKILSLETRLVPKNRTLLRDFGPLQPIFVKKNF
jgi:hypothetical protein